MKNIKNLPFLVFIMIFATFNVLAQTDKPKKKTKSSPNYDEQLAEEVGADDYGMRQFVLVILKTGKAKITDEKRRKELFAGHFANMGRLAKEGKLVLAGPFMEGGKKRGLFVFDVKTLEDAQKLVETDPTIKAGIFEVDMTKWYGSAALMKINEIHSKIQKTPIE